MLCYVGNKKQHNLGFPTFKLLPSTKKYFMTHCLNIIEVIGP